MKQQLLVEGTLRTVAFEAGGRDGLFVGELDGEPVEFEAALLAPGVVSLLVRSGAMAGQSFRCVFDADANGKSVHVGGKAFAYQLHDPRSLNARKQRAGGAEGTLLLKATMAGRVVKVLVEAGNEVAAHAGVVVIEAMKMQNELRAPHAGRVTEVRVAAGEMVSAGQVLAVIESSGEAD